jgi:hypothetical protein
LFYGRLVESVLLAEKSHFLLADPFSLSLELRDIAREIIAFGKLNDDEHQHADDEQRGHHDHQTANEIVKHIATVEACDQLPTTVS